MKQHIIFGSILVFFTLLFVSGEGTPTNNEAAFLTVTNLGSLSYEEASRAVNEIANQNHKLIVSLTSQIGQQDLPSDRKICAIYLLGELRPKDIKATQVLLEYVDFEATRGDLLIGYPRWGKYPAQEALSKIGMPAVEVILDVYLLKEENALRRHLMCLVIQNVLGKGIGPIIIKERIHGESNPTKRANLELALKEMEN